MKKSYDYLCDDSEWGVQMKITNGALTEFCRDFMAAVASLEEKYDVTVLLGPISYNADGFSSRMEVKNSRDPETIARNDFDANVWKYEHLGFREGMYKRIFIGADGQRYAVTGFNTRAKRRAIFVTRVSDGQKFTTNESFVREITNEVYAENLAEADHQS